MAEKTSFLYSGYIIDGIQMALTPAQMLHECTLEEVPAPDGDPGVIADESVDIFPSAHKFNEGKVDGYAAAILGQKHAFPLPFAASYTAAKVGQALIDAIWMAGHFRLGDLTLRADWKWNDREIGQMAAFYASVESASDYIDALGVKISRYSVTGGTCSAAFKATTVAEEDALDEEESLFRELPYRTANPRISRRRHCPSTLLPERSDWLIYIPFDTCDYRLGGSLLAQAEGVSPSTAPDIGDADYFIDCYEVVRELVEDGVVKAGATVGDGGLMGALQGMAAGTGAEITVQDVCKAYGGEFPVRVLFGEIPGVILQVADIDYDYVDAELLLQDVAYFPLGHPVPGGNGIRVTGKTDIHGILESLLNTLEGED